MKTLLLNKLLSTVIDHGLNVSIVITGVDDECADHIISKITSGNINQNVIIMTLDNSIKKINNQFKIKKNILQSKCLSTNRNRIIILKGLHKSNLQCQKLITSYIDSSIEYTSFLILTPGCVSNLSIQLLSRLTIIRMPRKQIKDTSLITKKKKKIQYINKLYLKLRSNGLAKKRIDITIRHTTKKMIEIIRNDGCIIKDIFRPIQKITICMNELWVSEIIVKYANIHANHPRMDKWIIMTFLIEIISIYQMV